MNGRDLTLGLVGALALGAVLGRRGSRSVSRWVYHLSYRSDLASIARQGLTPRLDTQDAWDNEPGVYFVNTFGYEAGAPESEESAWLRLPAPHALPASFWTNLQEGHTLVPFPPDTIEVWVDAKGHPVAKSDGVTWRPLREVVSKGSRATDPTSTPAFQRWFKKSQVVDEDGQPLVVYHGTGKAFDAFDPARLGDQTGAGNTAMGFFFAEDYNLAREMYAGKRGEVMEVYLSIQKPLRIRDAWDNDMGEALRKAARDYLDRDPETAEDWQAFRDYLREMRDIDGVEFTGYAGDPKFEQRVYLAFDPAQIKSVDNRGTFDPADPRISYNRGPAPTDAALRTLRAAMVKAARADTAYAPAQWKRAKDPLTGHCYGAAHLVQDRFGGEIVKGTVRGQAHAWNRLPGGREVDLTGSQYGGDGLHPLVKGEGVAASRSTNPRFARFAARVDAQLGRR